jgi:hypothetical protein
LAASSLLELAEEQRFRRAIEHELEYGWRKTGGLPPATARPLSEEQMMAIHGPRHRAPGAWAHWDEVCRDFEERERRRNDFVNGPTQGTDHA